MKTLRRAFPIVAVLGSLSLVGTLIGLNAENARGLHLGHKADGAVVRNHTYTLAAGDLWDAEHEEALDPAFTLDSGHTLPFTCTVDAANPEDWVRRTTEYYCSNFVVAYSAPSETAGTFHISFHLFSGVSNPLFRISGTSYNSENKGFTMNAQSYTPDGGESYEHGTVTFVENDGWDVTFAVSGYSWFRVELLTISYSCGA